MIGKAKSCPGGTALFNYVVNDKKGYELMRNYLSGITPKEMFANMAIIQNQNLRCTNNTISVVLSPTINDSSKLTDEQLKKLTEDFLEQMKLNPKTNQYIAFVHTEKEHKHVHILLNRVNFDGSIINDSFISNDAQKAAHEIALKNNLTSARNIKDEKEQKQKNENKAIIKEIRNANYRVLASKPKNLEDYIHKMKNYGIEVKPTINKQGNIQGFRFIHEATGTSLKASQVDRNLKLNKLFDTDSYSRPFPKTISETLEPPNTNNEEFKSCLVQNNLLISLLSKIGHQNQDDLQERKNKNSKKKRKKR